MSTQISRTVGGINMSVGSLAVEQLEQCVRTACSEMGRQWREGRPVLAEDVLAQMPELAEHSELVLELIYTEYVVREELGQQCTHEEWFERFPRWTTDLMQLLEVHRQLCEAETVQTAGNKWQELSTAGSTAGSIDFHGSTDSFGGRTRRQIPEDDQLGKLIGNYQLLEEIGRGGMGVVYRARQLNLNRDVALKMIISGEFASPREMTRFQTEAQSTAKLHHPHIVQIYEVSAHKQRPFLSMELITGGNLDSRLKVGLPGPRAAAELLRTIAQAVDYAHAQGVIHRDLKPCNVLLDEHDQPKVADFGLAKQLQEGQFECSRSMGPVGTPSYMAPETVGGTCHNVTPATDVYSLGVILYEMLTGKPPFVAETQLETLRQIVSDEPTAPTILNKQIPRDLETICLKCLQKDPRRRYATARELADDLQRYLRREPILAKPVGILERCVKWTRRRPLEAAFIAFLAISFFGMFALWRSAVASDYKARLAAENAVRHRDIAIREKAQVQRGEYFLRVGQAQGEYLSNMVGRANELLDECEPSMRHFEWNYLKRRCSSELLSMKGHKELLCVMAVTRDGNYAATGSGEWGVSWPGDIILWDLKTGNQLVQIAPNDGPIMALDFSPDGQYLASASYPWVGVKRAGVNLWDMQGNLVWRLPDRAVGSESIKFSPNGKMLAVAGVGEVQVWDIEKRKLIRALPCHPNHMVFDIDFDPSGTLLASVGRDGKAYIHDWMANKSMMVDGSHQDLRWVRFSPDGCRLAYSNYGASVCMLDLTDYLGGAKEIKQKPKIFRYEIGAIESFEFSLEGRRMGICSNDGSVLIVNSETGGVLQRLYTHNGMVRNLAFTNDNRLITAAREGSVKVWDLRYDQPVDRFNTGDLGTMGSISRMRFTRDGKRILTTITQSTSWGQGNPVLLAYDLDTLRNRSAFHGHSDYLTDVTESPDSAHLATSSLDKTVRIWNAATEKTERLLELPAAVTSVRFNTSGDHIVAACSDGTIQLWNWKENRILNSWQAHDAAINEIEVSPDGRSLATAGNDAMVRLWRLEDGQLLNELHGHNDRVFSITFSHNGQLIASCSADSTIKLWSVDSGDEVRTLRGHIREVYDIDFSSDDQRLVSGGRDYLVKVWDVASGREAISLRELGSTRCVAFHPSDRLVISAHDRIVHLYDARSKEHQFEEVAFAERNFDWSMAQGANARDKGLATAARINFQKATEFVPSRNYQYRRRGEALATLERWSEAASDYEMANILGNQHKDLHTCLALSNLAAGNRQNCLNYSNLIIDEAVRVYERGMTSISEMSDINDFIYFACILDHRPKSAERLIGILSEVIAKQREMKRATDAEENTLALLYYRCGWFHEAEAIMQDRPVNEKAYCADWSIRSLLARERGDHDAALQHLKRAEQLCPASLFNREGVTKKMRTWHLELPSRLLIMEAQSKLDQNP